MQVNRATECERDSGQKAQKPALGAAVEEDDPLDAFMAELRDVEKQSEAPAPDKKCKADVALDEEADNVADFMEARRRDGGTAAMVKTVNDADYASDDEVYALANAVDAADPQYEEERSADKKSVDPLPPVDHSIIEYDDFGKDFYEESPELAAMTPAEVNTTRQQMGMRVFGFDAPKPVQTFAQCGFDAPMMAAIKKAGYEKPTAIQAQALPAALSGRDVLGIAKTGSGKTAAFVLPMIVHIMDQPEVEKGAGPIGVIVVPTRELAEQIHKETRKFSKAYQLRVAAAFGGLSKFEQFKDLKHGSEIAVCTPGRMIDLIKMKACSMLRATYLVFDEADRMFDMGFEPQVRSIMGQVRSDRQTLLFTATMPTKVDNLVRDCLTTPVRITVGEVGGANQDIQQVVEVVAGDIPKEQWLMGHIAEFIDRGDVLVFANQKTRVDMLCDKLKAAGIKAAAIHGDMDQHSRMAVLHEYKAGKHHVLVATDVAARGLDIKSIKSVVNYDAAKEVDTHVHRIGRTGRAGDKEGIAYTLITPYETRFAGDLVSSMIAANQEVSQPLLDLASKDPRFKKGRKRAAGRGAGGGRGRGRRGGPQVGGAGLGFGNTGYAPGTSLTAAAATKGEAGYAPSGLGAAFNKGGFESTVDGTNASVASKYNDNEDMADDPPLPPPPSLVPDYSAEAAPQSAAGLQAAAVPPVMSASQSAAANMAGGVQQPAAVQQPVIPQQTAASQPQQFRTLQQAKQAAAAEAAAAAATSAAAAAAAAASAKQQAPPAQLQGTFSGFKGMYTNRFGTSFVSSGSTGGDQALKATIVAPKQQAQRSAMPAPIPVTERPLFNRPGGLGAAAYQASTHQALAAAQAIAARLSAQAPAPTPTPNPCNEWAGQPDFYQPSPAAALAAAQAVADRLAAAAPAAAAAPDAAAQAPPLPVPPQQHDWYEEPSSRPAAAPSGEAAMAAAQAIADRLAAQYFVASVPGPATTPAAPHQSNPWPPSTSSTAAPAPSAAAAAQAVADRLAAQAGALTGQAPQNGSAYGQLSEASQAYMQNEADRSVKRQKWDSR
ncbi:TPA: hypothetical protein ACH3X3_005761 [Trebouxia sp. C0006]